MSSTRREFIKDITAVGAVATTCSILAGGKTAEGTENVCSEESRCPYFDQPMYCKELSTSGLPLCDEKLI